MIAGVVFAEAVNITQLDLDVQRLIIPHNSEGNLIPNFFGVAIGGELCVFLKLLPVDLGDDVIDGKTRLFRRRAVINAAD